MTDLTTATAIELSRLYQSGAANPVIVAQQVLDKISRVNPRLNAFCFTDPATTMAQAQASALRWSQGLPLSAMDGVPVAIKDSIFTQGWPTRQASFTVDPDQDWTEDAPAVARLREAGAVFVGKTTMSEFGSSTYDSNSDLYGTVHNPWHINATPGGSSGGSAVAVAAGLVPVALCTDFGGSISVPSAFCGVFGLKPTAGRVPCWPSDVVELSTVGPMARSTSDLAMVMNVITQPDLRDSTALPYEHVNYVDALSGPVGHWRIAQIQTVGTAFVDGNQNDAIDAVVRRLQNLGTEITQINLDVDVAVDIFDKLARTKRLNQWRKIPPDKQRQTSRKFQKWAVIAHIKEDIYLQMCNRNQLCVDNNRLMQAYDAMIGPVTMPLRSDLDPIDQYLSPLSVYCSITKQPAVTIPIGLDSHSMPLSVVIIGNKHNDIELLRLAHNVEQQFPMPMCPVIL